MPIYEALASWWVGAAVMANFVIFTLEGVISFYFYFIYLQLRRSPSPEEGWQLSAVIVGSIKS